MTSSCQFGHANIITMSKVRITMTIPKLRVQLCDKVTSSCILTLYFSLDATNDDGRSGHLINHSKLARNLVPNVMEASDGPHIVFVAAKNILANQEVLYDYGERNPQIIQNHPWLRK